MKDRSPTSSARRARSGGDAYAAYPPAGRVLMTPEQIAQRVEQLADALVDCYDGRPVVVLTVLTGAMVFLADLIRRLPMPLEVAVASVRSYPGQATRSVGPTLTLPVDCDFAGRDVLIVDDILDSGQTLRAVQELVAAAGADRIRTCVLLRKDRPDLPNRPEADFVGFDVPDAFVVGYGLDFNGLHRNLPDIRVLPVHDGPAGGDEGSSA